MFFNFLFAHDEIKDTKPHKYSGIKNEIPLSLKELEFLSKHKEIVLGTDKSWKPYVLIDNYGNISGYDNSVLKLINNLTGANFKLKAGVWKDIVNEAEINKIDGLSTCVSHSERKKYFAFSKKYITMEKMLITSKTSDLQINSLDDLEGKTIAIYKSNLQEEKTARSFKNAKILKLDSVREVVDAVVTGKADAMFGNGATIYLANELGFSNLKLSYPLNSSLELKFGIRKDWSEAVSIINKALDYIGEQRLLELKSKWFLLDIQKEQKTNIEFSQEEIAYIKKKKVIKMCIDPNWMPFEQIKDKKHLGMSADFFELIKTKLPIDIKLIDSSSWSQSIQNIKNRKCDILSLAMKTPNRQGFLEFTTPYISVPLVIATRSNVSFISDFEDIKGKKIGIPKNYAFAEILRVKYPNLNIVNVKNIEDGLKKVNDNELFGYIGTLASIAYQFQNNFIGDLKIAGKFDEKLELSIAVRSDEVELKNIFQKALDEISEVQKREIYNNWTAVKYDQSVDYELVVKVVLVSLFILSTIFYWNIRLKREISKRKLAEQELQKLNNTLELKILKAVEDVQIKEQQLQEQSRLAQMGEMINMIAHQWRQPLGAISSALFVVDTKLKMNQFDFTKEEDKNRFLELLDKKHKNVNEYVHFLSTTIDDFRNFFKPNKEKELLPVTHCIEKALQMVSASMKNKDITIVKNFYSQENISLYQNEMIQVILNILKNAEDNFTEKGIKEKEIRILTQEVYKEEYTIRISDNGGGIDKDVLPKIFDPYFSTKKEKNGTGLGLYMSKVIVEKHHNGKLDVYNVDGGVCFEIRLHNKLLGVK